jgi:hypothetical protein
MDLDELSKRILRLYKKVGVLSLGQLRKLDESRSIEDDIEKINDKVNADIQLFADARDQIDLGIRDGDVEERLKEAEKAKLTSNASIQDIIANSIEAHRNQIVSPEDEPELSGAAELEEEELSRSSIMSLSTGDIAEIAII